MVEGLLLESFAGTRPVEALTNKRAEQRFVTPRAFILLVVPYD